MYNAAFVFLPHVLVQRSTLTTDKRVGKQHTSTSYVFPSTQATCFGHYISSVT